MRNLVGFAAVQGDRPVYATHVTNQFPEDIAEWSYVVLANAAYVQSSTIPRARAVHVIRNPLSIIVSAYFSHRLTHPTSAWPELEAQRQRLLKASKRVGLELTAEFLDRRDFGASAMGPLFSLRHWNFDDPGILTVRMEDLVMFPEAIFGRVFEFVGEPLNPAFATVLEANSFANLTGGRAPGNADETSHFRSGSPVDWANHLSYWQAKRYYRRYQAIVDRCYPEVARIFN